MSKKYVVQRANVCGGILLSKTKYASENTDTTAEMISRVGPMLFSVGYDGLSNDLLCTTPSQYPINGKSRIAKGKFFIDSYIELEELLKYLNYKEDLTQKDLWEIYRKILMNPKWLEKHKELFGWEIEEGTGEWVHHKDLETLPFSMYASLGEIIPSTKQKAREEKRPLIIEPNYALINKRK